MCYSRFLTDSPCRRQSRRSGMSLVELVMSMGLLAMIMMPIIALMSSTFHIYESTQSRQTGALSRHSCLDVLAERCGSATAVRSVGRSSVVFEMRDGSTARCFLRRGVMNWRQGGVTEPLVAGLNSLSFSLVDQTATSAGSLLQVKATTQPDPEVAAKTSTTTLWIRPAI